jgi:hypothetical protein
MQVEGNKLKLDKTLWVQFEGVDSAEEGDLMVYTGRSEDSYVKVFNQFGRLLKLYTFGGGKWIDTETNAEPASLDESQAGRLTGQPGARRKRPPRSARRPRSGRLRRSASQPQSARRRPSARAAPPRCAPAASGLPPGGRPPSAVRLNVAQASAVPVSAALAKEKLQARLAGRSAARAAASVGHRLRAGATLVA